MKKVTLALAMLFVSIFSTFASGASKDDVIKGIHKLEKSLGKEETPTKTLKSKSWDITALQQYKSQLQEAFTHVQDSIKQAKSYQASLRGENTKLDTTTQPTVRLNSPVPTRVSYGANPDSLFILFLQDEKKDTTNTLFKQALKSQHVAMPNGKKFLHTDKLSSGWEILTMKKDSLGKLTFKYEPLPAGKLIGVWTDGRTYFSDKFALLHKGKVLNAEDQSLVAGLYSSVEQLKQADKVHTADIADARTHAEDVANQSTDYSKHYTDTTITRRLNPVIEQTNNNTANIDSLYKMVNADHKAISSLSTRTYWGGGILFLLIVIGAITVSRSISNNRDKFTAALNNREKQIRADLGKKVEEEQP